MYIRKQTWNAGLNNALLQTERVASQKRVDAAMKQTRGKSSDEICLQRLKNALEKSQVRYTALLKQKEMIDRHKALETGIKYRNVKVYK
jgi:hypothetical protein